MLPDRVSNPGPLTYESGAPPIALRGPAEVKIVWHVSRSSGLAKTILQGTVKGKRKRGRQKKRWEDNIKEWTGMDFACSTRAAENRTRWKGIVANSSVVPLRLSKVMGQNRIEFKPVFCGPSFYFI